MDFKGITKWNFIDSIIYSIENLVSKITISVKESRDKLPEPEEMTEAATKELQEENEELKQYRIPAHLIETDGKYICPVCKKEISDIESFKNNDIKYCNVCGKRIILPETISHYGMNYVNNLVKSNIV